MNGLINDLKEAFYFSINTYIIITNNNNEKVEIIVVSNLKLSKLKNLTQKMTNILLNMHLN